MPTNSTPSLPNIASAWQQALEAVAHLLPPQVHTNDAQALSALPIFAVVVVTPNALWQATDLDQAAIDAHLQQWADATPNWQLVSVPDDAPTSAAFAEHIAAYPAVSSVSVGRYLLLPTQAHLMTREKKHAAARVIDEQITAHLRQLLDTLAPQDHPSAPRLDCHILSIGHMLREHRLVCFDMDSTLIEQEVIVALAEQADVGEQVAAITESAMRGEIDFDASFTQRMNLLAGIPIEVLDRVYDTLTFSAGAEATLRLFAALGYHTVLLSGGFTYFAQRIAKRLHIDEVHANWLDIDADQVTGAVVPPIINGDKKAALVEQIAKQQGLTLQEVVCVGDGANDLAMLAQADVGVAYRAKPIVQARADAAVNVTGLDGVLYVLGYPSLTGHA